MKKVRSSQAAILILNWVKQFFPVNIVIKPGMSSLPFTNQIFFTRASYCPSVVFVSLLLQSCCTCATCVTLVWNYCYPCVARILLVSHWCCTRAALVSLVFQSCWTHVAHFALVSHLCSSCRTRITACMNKRMKIFV